ncbi:thiaminase II [Campylobacter sp. P255]|uniref:thiaminase II n=1 Tax=Campylobacter sp. P255 TaxID=1979368 RepID=UPI000EAA952D|nr:thiaminase II [Campylobacter sp. P255]RKO64184.1 thiaminase II [Campylobacter sp. P255]
MLLDKLIKENKAIWDKYIHHEFVQKLQNGTLEKEVFLFYLKQDYIFLNHYAKCYALLALNANNAKEIQFAIKNQNYTLESELELHRSILKLGVDVDSLSYKDESLTNIAYTRYLLSVGQSGDYLDMLCALSACAIGYAYIGEAIYNDLDETVLKNHPYREWILTYSGKEFQDEIRSFKDFFNAYTNSVSEKKFKKLSEIFYTTVRLEVAFWQHSLEQKMQI